MRKYGFSPRYELGIISCGKKKNPLATKARSLYTGTLFRLTLLHALQRCDQVVIMSAKYGLLSPDDNVKFYELHIKTLTWKEKQQLENKIQKQFRSYSECKTVLSYLPKDYQEVFNKAVSQTKVFRPYHLGLHKKTRTLSNEIKNYGKAPSRR